MYNNIKIFVTVIVDERRDDYMTVQEWEKDFYGNNVTITTRDNECVIYRIRDDSGRFSSNTF